MTVAIDTVGPLNCTELEEDSGEEAGGVVPAAQDQLHSAASKSVVESGMFSVFLDRLLAIVWNTLSQP